jgi:F420-dependent oxidoreductase-like protein
MRLCIFVEPQLGASYDDQLRAAQRTEECGFEGFFRSDHYLTMGGDGLPGPTDSWVALGALAVQTSRIRLGTMVTSATFRLPGPLAISVAQVDAMSGGRVELGIGAGWYEREHAAYGIPFPPVGERFDRLEEQLEIITGLWTAPPAGFSFSGKHYTVSDSPALPRPVQSPRPPVIVGGSGPRRTPALAARFADEINVPFRAASEVAAMYGRVRAACDSIGRAPLVQSTAVTVVCGRTADEVRRRSEAAGDASSRVGEGAAVGSPAEVVEQLGAYLEAGASRLFLQLVDMRDLDQIDLIAAEVAPQLP